MTENTMVPIIGYDENGSVNPKKIDITEINLASMCRLNVNDSIVQSIREEYLP